MAVDAAAIATAPEATVNPAPEPTQTAPTAEAEAAAPLADPTADQSSSAAAEATEETRPEDAKSRSERRAEARRQAAEQKAEADRKAAEETAFNARLEKALAERDRLKAEADQREAADKAAREKFSKFFGTPEEVAELQKVARQPSQIVGDYDTADEIAAKNKSNAERNAAQAKLDEFTGRWEMRDVVRAEERVRAYGEMAGEYETGATLEGVDAAAYRAAGSVTDALKVLRDSVWASAQAPLLAEIAELKEDLAMAESERNAAQAAAGGRAPGALSGGTGSSASGALTFERYSDMTSEDRRKMLATPEGRAAIDRMVRGGAA